METVLRGWPWLGLVLGCVGLVVLLAQRRPGAWSERWRDPDWLLWLPLPIYMLHQFEEHGVDLLGRSYAFRAALCETIGWSGALADCPATEWFVLAVNPGTVWIAGVAAGVFGARRAMIGAATLGIPAINTIAHVVSAVRTHAYNPGLATALVLFVPMCVWIFRALVQRGLLTPIRVAAAMVSGVALHAVLIGSLVLHMRGLIGEPLLVITQFANGFLPIGVGWRLPNPAATAPSA
jgi:hypothetical protein